MSLLLTQLLNGFQLGVFLFLLSAGLTLVLGIMNFVNMAHGAFYMFGAYFAATVFERSGSFLLAAVVAVPLTLAGAMVLERLVISRLYRRDHLDQVLVTFGLILCGDETVRIVWGQAPLYLAVPDTLSGSVAGYPVWRLVIIGAGLLVALGLYLAIQKTRVGMLIRAGASDPAMVQALGVNIGRINALVFGAGAALAGLAGLMAGPLLSVQPGMGEAILIPAFVVLVTGGIGSIRGAFLGALIVGLVDTLGRAYLPGLFHQLMSRSLAQAAGPAVASMLIYLLMAVVLAVRPQGLFPVRQR
ncbi:branched-chain amino acid ABC transporter permease [Pelomonas sp. KK5]|uniref:branched-chain amino acid ABC transporter permease n=1 Tax=Pelomonas sp. KK5 TaxID=1855730 RepID=UPI00097C1842|nr:branched-chain amino acid ABC transporter permease [Pelomonas sp. KK5]